MNQENKHKAIASTITVFSMSVILLILFFCGMEHQNPPPQPKKSIMIELDFDTGGGGGGGNESAPTPTRTPQPSGEHVATQDFEDAPGLSLSSRLLNSTVYCISDQQYPYYDYQFIQVFYLPYLTCFFCIYVSLL